MKIEVYGIYAEDLFRWFLNHVEDSCGDGCALIVCKNYEEAAKYFRDWFRQEFAMEFYYPPDRKVSGMVNYHDCNENFMFSDQILSIFDGDYTFIVKENCKFTKTYNSNFNHYIKPDSIIEAI